MTIHDLAFLRAPEGLPTEWVRELSTTVPRSARRAHRVITVSEFSRRDIVERLGVEADRVQAIHHGIPQECVPPRDPEALAEASSSSRRHAAGFTLERWRDEIGTRLEEAWGRPLADGESPGEPP